jgi:hypothetical protein
VTHPYYSAGNPRFNHVAMSAPSEFLEGSAAQDLCRFFDEVLGFSELPTMTIPGKRLIFSCVHWDQFIFLIAEDDPMRCPRMDHYGLAVGALEDLVGIRDRARLFAEQDDRVDLIDLSVDDQGVVKIHSIYLGYLLPMLCEIQFWEFPNAA